MNKQIYEIRNPPTPQMIIDLEKSVKAQDSPGYANWCKIFNLQQAAQTLIYMQESGFADMESLIVAQREAKNDAADIQNQIRANKAEIKSLSDQKNNARVLYTLLLDRHKLSVKNGWLDENGDVFNFFKREEMERQLGLSERTVLKVMQELKALSLVEETHQGLNMPNKIYLLSPAIGDAESPTPYIDPEADSSEDSGTDTE